MTLLFALCVGELQRNLRVFERLLDGNGVGGSPAAFHPYLREANDRV